MPAPVRSISSTLRGRTCFGGLDLSTTTDVTALAWVFPPEQDDGLWHVLSRYFVPEENLRKRAERDRVPYDLWTRQGFIEATPGNVVDYGAIEQRILADAALFQVKEIAYDPWNATHIALRLQDEGATMVEFRQGFRSMAAPTRELEKLIVSRKLAHGGNPVTRWMAANVAVAQDPAGNLKPAKDKSTERIDGIVAAIMAIGRAMVAQEEPQPEYSHVLCLSRWRPPTPRIPPATSSGPRTRAPSASMASSPPSWPSAAPWSPRMSRSPRTRCSGSDLRMAPLFPEERVIVHVVLFLELVDQLAIHEGEDVTLLLPDLVGLERPLGLGAPLQAAEMPGPQVLGAGQHAVGDYTQFLEGLLHMGADRRNGAEAAAVVSDDDLTAFRSVGTVLLIA